MTTEAISSSEYSEEVYSGVESTSRTREEEVAAEIFQVYGHKSSSSIYVRDPVRIDGLLMLDAGDELVIESSIKAQDGLLTGKTIRLLDGASVQAANYLSVKADRLFLSDALVSQPLKWKVEVGELHICGQVPYETFWLVREAAPKSATETDEVDESSETSVTTTSSSGGSSVYSDETSEKSLYSNSTEQSVYSHETGASAVEEEHETFYSSETAASQVEETLYSTQASSEESYSSTSGYSYISQDSTSFSEQSRSY